MCAGGSGAGQGLPWAWHSAHSGAAAGRVRALGPRARRTHRGPVREASAAPQRGVWRLLAEAVTAALRGVG